MQVKIVDTTLRDGEQSAGIALGIEEKLEIAMLLDKMGIYQIEAGIPAMGGIEKKSIEKIVTLGLKSKISVWNRMVIKDIEHSLDTGAEIIHISIPTSDIQLRTKLCKDKNWVVENMKKCICFTKERGSHVTIGLEDASRADMEFLMDIICAAKAEGVKRVRYADTVGILHRQRIYEEVKRIREEQDIAIEMHAHNDLGMAVANSIAAVEGGAEFVDCTIGGLGERAGNCNYFQFLISAKECLGDFKDVELSKVLGMQNKILEIIHK